MLTIANSKIVGATRCPTQVGDVSEMVTRSYALLQLLLEWLEEGMLGELGAKIIRDLMLVENFEKFQQTSGVWSSSIYTAGDEIQSTETGIKFGNPGEYVFVGEAEVPEKAVEDGDPMEHHDI